MNALNASAREGDLVELLRFLGINESNLVDGKSGEPIPLLELEKRLMRKEKKLSGRGDDLRYLARREGERKRWIAAKTNGGTLQIRYVFWRSTPGEEGFVALCKLQHEPISRELSVGEISMMVRAYKPPWWRRVTTHRGWQQLPA